MLRRQFIPDSGEGGFTLLELLVAATIGLAVLAMTLAATMSSKDLFTKDLVRTRVNQDLRGALDIIGMDARVAGEHFNGSFPAIQILNGLNDAPDELHLYRNLLDESLKVCKAITKNTSATEVFFATGTAAGCTYGDNTHNFTAWKNYRTTHGDKVRVYIFNTSTNKGEYFDYIGEVNGGTSYEITRTAGLWGNDYDTSSSTVYILENWKFQVRSSTLQLVENGFETVPYNVAFNVTNLQARVIMPDTSVLQDFSASEDWTLMSSLEVSLTGQDTHKGQPTTRTLTARFFPRNVLSN